MLKFGGFEDFLYLEEGNCVYYNPYLIYYTMSDKIPLSLDEEFRFYSGTLMNNWFALKLLIAHSEDSVQMTNNKVEGLFEVLMNSIHGIINSKVEVLDCVDNVEDYIDLKFNTYIEDNSCEEVLNELLNYHNLLSCNKREVLSSAIQHLKEKRNIFSNEEYNPDLIVRVTTSHHSSHQPIHAQNNLSMEVSRETSQLDLTTEANVLPNEEWETVSHRRCKTAKKRKN